MSNLHRNRSFIGGGKLYLRQRSTDPLVTFPALPFGNADLQLSVKIRKHSVTFNSQVAVTLLLAAIMTLTVNAL